MKQTLCPVCAKGILTDQVENTIVRCSDCNVSWTFIANYVNVVKLYQEDVYKVIDNRGSIFEKIIFWETERIIKSIKKLSKGAQQRKILDFGSGKGHFLFKCQKEGWQCKGIETAKERAAFSKDKYGVVVSEDYYEKGLIDNGDFDVITLLHVLEHIPKPMILIKNLIVNLKFNGTLIIEVPNVDSWQSWIAGKNWMHLDLPKHLSHWNNDVLTYHVEQLGLKKYHVEGFSFHLGVLGMTQSILSRLGFKKNIISELKNSKRILLILPIVLILPISVFLELLSLAFEKGGVLRVYFKKQ